MPSSAQNSVSQSTLLSIGSSVIFSAFFFTFIQANNIVKIKLWTGPQLGPQLHVSDFVYGLKFILRPIANSELVDGLS